MDMDMENENDIIVGGIVGTGIGGGVDVGAGVGGGVGLATGGGVGSTTGGVEGARLGAGEGSGDKAVGIGVGASVGTIGHNSRLGGPKSDWISRRDANSQKE